MPLHFPPCTGQIYALPKAAGNPVGILIQRVPDQPPLLVYGHARMRGSRASEKEHSHQAHRHHVQVRAFSFAAGGLAAAQGLHERLLRAVVRAPTAFYDCTPSGRVLNRFSSDVATADDSLPFIMCVPCGAPCVLLKSRNVMDAAWCCTCNSLCGCWCDVHKREDLPNSGAHIFWRFLPVSVKSRLAKYGNGLTGHGG